MSWYAQAWAEEAPVADVYERSIITLMAHRADSDGTGAYPPKAKMAAYSMCAVETIKPRLRALVKRGLIARGDQSLTAHLPADKRPVVYDLLIPYDWYSASQRETVNRERAQRGHGPLTPTDRPPIAPPPARKVRIDYGVPRLGPHGRPPQPPADDPDDHDDPDESGGSGGSGGVGPTGPDTPTPRPPADPAEAPREHLGDQADPAGGLEHPPRSEPGQMAEGSLTPPAGGLQDPPWGVLKTPNTDLGTCPSTAGGPPPAPPAPAAPQTGATGPNTPGDAAYGVTSEPELISSHQTARARTRARTREAGPPPPPQPTPHAPTDPVTVTPAATGHRPTRPRSQRHPRGRRISGLRRAPVAAVPEIATGTRFAPAAIAAPTRPTAPLTSGWWPR